MTLYWNTKRPKIGEEFEIKGVIYKVTSVKGKEVRMERVG